MGVGNQLLSCMHWATKGVDLILSNMRPENRSGLPSVGLLMRKVALLMNCTSFMVKTFFALSAQLLWQTLLARHGSWQSPKPGQYFCHQVLESNPDMHGWCFHHWCKVTILSSSNADFGVEAGWTGENKGVLQAKLWASSERHWYDKWMLHLDDTCNGYDIHLYIAQSLSSKERQPCHSKTWGSKTGMYSYIRVGQSYDLIFATNQKLIVFVAGSLLMLLWQEPVSLLLDSSISGDDAQDNMFVGKFGKRNSKYKFDTWILDVYTKLNEEKDLLWCWSWHNCEEEEISANSQK